MKKLTETKLTKMTGAELVDTYNELAALLGKKAVKRFATKADALRRTGELAREAGALGTSDHAGTPKATAPEATPAPEKKAPEEGAAKVLTAGDAAAAGRSGIALALHAIATESGPLDREELVARTLAEYRPPRSTRYDRAFVLGYVAHGLRVGFLRNAE